MADPTIQPSSEIKTEGVLCQADLWKTIAARRQAFDGFVWQTAGFALSAQAFLYVIALGGSNVPAARVIALFLSAVCALATIQLMCKHRYHEKLDADYLHSIEKRQGLEELHGRRKDDDKPFWIKWSSVSVWLGLQWTFFIVSAVKLVCVTYSYGRYGDDPLATLKSITTYAVTNQAVPKVESLISTKPVQGASNLESAAPAKPSRTNDASAPK